jgi:hypothetical protein
MVSVTLEQIVSMEPCHMERRAAIFRPGERLTVEQALERGVTAPEVLWVAGRLGLVKECGEFAAGCAKRAAGYAAECAAERAEYAAEYAAERAERAAQKVDLARIFGGE